MIYALIDRATLDRVGWSIQKISKKNWEFKYWDSTIIGDKRLLSPRGSWVNIIEDTEIIYRGKSLLLNW